MTRWAIAAIAGAVLTATAVAFALSDSALRPAALTLDSTAAAESAVGAAGPASPHAQPKVAFPLAEPGKPIMQFGMDFVSYTTLEEPFLNHARHSSPGWNASPSGSLPELTFADLRDQGLVDPDTMYPAGVPKGYPHVGGPVLRFGARFWPKQYAGTWVAEWDGDADLTFGWVNHTWIRRINRNRIEVTMPADNTDWMRIEARRVGPEGFRNLRVYRKENESLVKAGRLLDPRFREFASRYHILRTAVPQHVNGHWARSIDDMMSTDVTGWGSWQPVKDGGHLGGPPWSVFFRMAEETDTALWLHVTGILGAPDGFADAALQTNGDAIRKLAEQNARAIVASPEWDRAAARLVDDLIASSYPEDRILYVEQNNEIWNYGHPFWRHTHYYTGIGQGVSGGKKGGYGRYGYGYLSARFVHAFEAALAERGRRQAWVAVIASQMAWDQMTRDALEGYREYFVERGLDPKPWLAIAGVSTASYYTAVFGREGVIRSESDAAHGPALKAAMRADPQGFAKRVSDWVISGPETAVGTIPWIVRQRNMHQRLAEEYGAKFIGDYEGHDHADNWGALTNDVEWSQWMDAWRHDEEGYRVTRAWIEAMRKQNPDAIISNFVGVGPRITREGRLSAPWYDGGYEDEGSGRRRAFREYLRN